MAPLVPYGPLFWRLRPQTPIWSAFGLHMDPKLVHMDPYGPIWEIEFLNPMWSPPGTRHRVHLGPYIGSTWDPTWGSRRAGGEKLVCPWVDCHKFRCMRNS